MSNLIIKKFDGSHIHTFMWKNKPCWIANEIVSLFGYSDPSTTIGQCIEAEQFEVGVEYETLIKEDLKTFKKMVNQLTKTKLVSQNTANLIIFYEDGLYGFLQYTDKPIGVRFRKWIRRDVLPEIRETGAYLTNKANPEMLRKKADEIESLLTLNETAKIMLPIFEEVGLKPQYKAMALKQIYRKGGIELPIEEVVVDKELFDLQSIAKEVGVYSSSNKPHGKAINAIVVQLEINDNERETVSYERHGHVGTTTQYTKSVIDKVKKWLINNSYPDEINGKDKKFKVIYKLQK